jgi:hypothetical protein
MIYSCTGDLVMKRILFGVSAAFATVALAAVPMTAHARDHGGNNGAAIGLGILGGVAIGAAVASTANPYYGGYGYPYYAAPAPSYYYPQQGYYYAPSGSYTGYYHNEY